MKKLLLAIFCCYLGIACTSTDSEQSEALLINENYTIVPQPIHLKKGEGHFVLNEQTKIIDLTGNKAEALYLQNLIAASATFTPEILYKRPEAINNAIVLGNIGVDEETFRNSDIKGASYQLAITKEAINIAGMDASGVFYAIQTLRQMLPKAFHQQEKRASWGIMAVNIQDKPVFEWRGMLLDCCRHFFSKEVVKKYIDLLAYYKMNTLHWHLTEDQGWRIAIDKYPKLTEIGAWRKGEDGKPYGGFYSKEDIQEIVAYAQERHINVVPEIELPGHSQAAIAAYPHLSCTGEQLEVGTKWGVFKDVYCAGNDSTFIFLQDVLTEVMELFPSRYIHIGGDECPKYRWEHCEKCQKRIKEEGLKDEHELQSYFIDRINTFLKSKGKQIVGWDEILEGGLPAGAMVQSWRGMNGALEAASHLNKAISSPTSHAYFDYALSAIDLEKVYEFNPIPEELDSNYHAYILGGECNMWTEWVPDEATLDSRVFPRLLAMSEVLWSAPKERNYPAFYQRVQQQYDALDAFGVAYGAETIPVRIEAYTSPASINVKMNKGTADLDLHYTLDGTNPTTKSERYEGALPIKESGMLNVQAFKKGQPYGDMLERTFDKHLGNGLEPTLSYTYSEYYTGGGSQAVTNGVRGTDNFRDGNWQAVQKVPMEITVDLQEPKSVSSLSTAFFQKQDSWIFLPTKVDFFYSEDGHQYTKAGSLENSISPKKDGSFIEEFKLEIPPVKARYVRLKAHNITYCPDWHAAAGSEAWLFVDEFVIK